MNNELKNRIKKADSKLQSVKQNLEVVSASLNSEIKAFGDYRLEVLKNTVGRFKKDLNSLKKNLRAGEYLIPEEVEIKEVMALSSKDGSFIPELNLQIVENVSKVVFVGANKILDTVARRKGVNLNTNNYTGGSSGPWWLELLQAAFTVAAAVAEKKEQEKIEVERYEAEADVLCEKMHAHIVLCDKISRRLKELIFVTDGLEKRCITELEKLESIIDVFNSENSTHLQAFSKAKILIKNISDVSKVEILDSNNRLSLFDQQYILKSRKILAETL